MSNLSANSRIGGRPRQVAGRKGGKQEQATLCSAGLVADGFLKHRFLPLYQQGNVLPDKEQVEKGFFNSLSILADCNHFCPLDVSGKPYPYNILLAHWDAGQQLERLSPDIELSIVADQREEVMLSTTETVNTGTTLYYIPVLPLYRLLQDRWQRKCGELLLSVCSYLHHVAAIPYYRDVSSYLFYHYEMLEEWIEEDPDSTGGQEYLHNMAAVRKASYYGDIVQRKMYNPCHLDHFKERVCSFVPLNPFQSTCLKTAQAALDIWEQYPGHNLFQHISDNKVSDEEEDEEPEESVRINEYVSFVAENEGSLYDSLYEMVNSEFNERSTMQEPTITCLYDSPGKAGNSLDFERQLFELITDLCTLLNNLP